MTLHLDAFALRIFNYLHSQASREYRKGILSLLERNPEAKLLDCGCGDGEFTLKVAEMIGTWRIYGIDIEEGSVIKAKAKGIEASQGDLSQRFPFENESLDVILANQVIEHLNYTDTFLTEIRRVLKVGGYAVMTTPNLASIHNILFLILGKQPDAASVSDEVHAGVWRPLKRWITPLDPPDPVRRPWHRRIFTLGALKELLEYHGFKAERTIGSGFLPFPTPLARVMCSIDKRHAVIITVKVRKR